MQKYENLIHMNKKDKEANGAQRIGKQFEQVLISLAAHSAFLVS